MRGFLMFAVLGMNSLSLCAESTNYFRADSMVDMNVKTTVIQLEIPYPGPISDVCGIRLVSTENDYNEEIFVDAIEVREGFGSDTVVNGDILKARMTSDKYSSLTYMLNRVMTYHGSVSIATKDGTYFSDLVKKMFPSHSGDVAEPRIAFTAMLCKMPSVR